MATQHKSSKACMQHKITIYQFSGISSLIYLRLVSSVVPPEERVCEVVSNE